MQKILIRVILLSVIVVLILSCQKEVNGEIFNGTNPVNNPLIGTWKFASLSAKTKADITATDGVDTEKAVTLADYTTFNNKGAITFGSNEFKAQGLAYDLQGTAKVYFYLNNILEDSLDMPFDFSLPPSNSAGEYKLVGADSVFFKAGFVTVGLDSMESKPIGYKYSITGNKLTLKTKFNNSFNETDAGIVYNIKQFADITVLLEKQ